VVQVAASMQRSGSDSLGQGELELVIEGMRPFEFVARSRR
jgi:hypothetical protein